MPPRTRRREGKWVRSARPLTAEAVRKVNSARPLENFVLIWGLYKETLALPDAYCGAQVGECSRLRPRQSVFTRSRWKADPGLLVLLIRFGPDFIGGDA